jgi:hypothetical protein
MLFLVPRKWISPKKESAQMRHMVPVLAGMRRDNISRSKMNG